MEINTIYFSTCSTIFNILLVLFVNEEINLTDCRFVP